MATGPRIILVAAVDPVGRGGQTGRWHPTGVYDERARYGWRLIGANNRELGRSPETYEGLPGARAAATRAQTRAGELVHLFSSDQSDGSWSWRASLDGEVVAVSGRTYLRQRECVYNYQQFVVALETATVTLTPTVRPRVRLRRMASPRQHRPDNGLPFEPAAP